MPIFIRTCDDDGKWSTDQQKGQSTEEQDALHNLLFQDPEQTAVYTCPECGMSAAICTYKKKKERPAHSTHPCAYCGENMYIVGNLKDLMNEFGQDQDHEPCN